MFIDARSLPNEELLEADLCIIGGGAAGLTLALEMRGAGLRIIVLESGEFGLDERTQSLYTGPNLSFPADPLDKARLRFLGGSSNHWAGNCMRLDAIDFEARDEIPHSGWPIGLTDLEPYYPRAQAWVETPADGPYDSPERRDEIGHGPIDSNPDLLRTFLYAESPPTAFGASYEDDLAAAEDITVYLNANVLELEANDTASAVTGLACAVIDGPEFKVAARRYVLAAGGIEIPRLLLLSNRIAPAGLGNENDLVGRFFTDHISLRPALNVMLPTSDPALRLYSDNHEIAGGFYMRGALAASESLLRRERLANFNFFLFSGTDRSPGMDAAIGLRRALGRGGVPDDLGWHLGNVLTDLDGATNVIYRRLTGTDEDLIERTWLDPWSVCESVPNPESRVRLIEERDEIFGQNRVGLDWRPAAQDLETTRRATEVLAMELGRLGYGRVWSEVLADPDNWPRTYHGKHHCGTTRMSDDPKTGVVNRDCQVHGIPNLFIASSAVFPTHGHATPTLTIVALAVRLADHLKAEAAKGAF